MRQWIVGGLLAVALVVLAFVLPEREELPDQEDSAEAREDAAARDTDTVSKLFDAARDGDDEVYLQLLGGPLRESFERTRAEMGAEAFREDLRRSASGIRGLAVERGENAPPGMVAIEVDIVFDRRNERQRMLLEEQDGGWVITSIETAQTYKPPVPYNTPVFRP